MLYIFCRKYSQEYFRQCSPTAWFTFFQRVVVTALQNNLKKEKTVLLGGLVRGSNFQCIRDSRVIESTWQIKKQIRKSRDPRDSSVEKKLFSRTPPSIPRQSILYFNLDVWHSRKAKNPVNAVVPPPNRPEFLCQCVLPCVAKACAVHPVFSWVVGNCYGQKSEANVLGP